MLIADGVRLTRQGLWEVLRLHGVLARQCGANTDDIVTAVVAAPTDVVVLNAATVDLAAAVAAVRAERRLPLVAVSVSKTVDGVTRCADLGLAGFVTADDSIEDLLNVIRTARADEPCCPPDAIPMLMQAVRRRASAVPDTHRLTNREAEIVALLRQGLANKEIAVRLGITTRTVKNHLHHVYDRFGVHSRGEIVALLHD